MTATLTAVTAAALLTWLVWERRAPAFRNDQGRTRIFRNVFLGMAGFAMTLVLVTPVSLAAAEFGPGWRSEWPFWVRLASDLLLLEFFIYWWHRANHEVPFLWRFHRVHHYDHFLDVTSALRFHPGELFFSAAARGAYVLAFDISAPAILVFDSLVVISAGFHHSNVSLRERTDHRLRRLVVTPIHHRIHHIPKQHYTDSNYGTLLTVFDRLFGSFRQAETEGRYGVEEARDKPFRELMTDPFR